LLTNKLKWWRHTYFFVPLVQRDEDKLLGRQEYEHLLPGQSHDVDREQAEQSFQGTQI